MFTLKIYQYLNNTAFLLGFKTIYIYYTLNYANPIITNYKYSQTNSDKWNLKRKIYSLIKR